MAQPTSSTALGSTTAPELQAPSSGPMHEVELFGVPRLLAGRARVPASGTTLAEVAADLALAAPKLAGPVIQEDTGWLLPGYSFVVDERFTREPSQPLAAGASILLVASAAGG
ncbi:MAG: MoaD/ThiS family protein [Thermomicrobiales bacterium]